MAHRRRTLIGPLVLGIETSCDDTAVGIVGAGKRILANRVHSQHREHRPFGGIVPEIAARSHVDHLDRLLKAALRDAKVSLKQIDAVAATAGPGLIGGLMVGLVSAKALALAAGKPFLAINHLEGHALSPRLVADVAFPYLLLLISGGHCQLVSVEGVGGYRRLGTTIDDAAGEAFDKGAKLLGLGLPGGPNLEKAARKGRADAFQFPRPMRGRKGCDFSFSGLKTALLHEVKRHKRLTAKLAADLAASYQAAIADSLVDRAANAMKMFSKGTKGNAKPVFVLAGGVAANALIRRRFEGLCRNQGFRFFAPPPKLCTDNGAIIAWAGLERLGLGQSHGLDAPARARWPLDENARPKIGFGRKGPKA
jgi:tRNA N6-adenosine threonylcarbamoyltransferase